MKLNFNFQLKDLAGNDVPGDAGNTARVLANTIASLNRGNSIKMYDWALKLWNLKPIEIDDIDALMLEEIIETTDMLTIAAKAQMKQYIISLKPKTTK